MLTPYGCSYLFHPVREAVELTADGLPPFAGTGSFSAPLFGGPGMIPGRRLRGPGPIQRLYQEDVVFSRSGSGPGDINRQGGGD